MEGEKNNREKLVAEFMRPKMEREVGELDELVKTGNGSVRDNAKLEFLKRKLGKI